MCQLNFVVRCYGWGATSEDWFEIGIFEEGWSVSANLSRSRGRQLRTISARIDRLYNFIADCIHTKKLCSRFSSIEVQFYTENGRFAFLSSPFRGLGATYDVHLRLIRKRIMDFVLVLRELFARCYSWGAASEHQLKIVIFTPTGSVWPRISDRRGSHTNHSFCQKTKMNVLSGL